MKLTEQDIEMFKSLYGGNLGRQLSDYVERLKHYLFDPNTLTEQNLNSRKEAVKIIDEYLIKKIQLQNPNKTTDLNEYT